METSKLESLSEKDLQDFELYLRFKNGLTANKGGIEKKTYYLVKRPSKKYGYIYQAEYIGENGKRLPTKYSTGTNDFETANKWAVENRERCLTEYEGRAELTALETYYNEGSKLFDYEKMDGWKLSALVQKQRQNFLKNHIIPFFQTAKVHCLNQITPIHIKELKKFLSSDKGLKPQTINYNLVSFKKCLAILKDAGKITTDFTNVSFTMKGSKKAEKPRGIYGIDTLKGVFGKEWNNELYRVLCTIIYTTGMRNSEIQRLRFNDIEKIQGVYFLNVRGTKSKNAVRKVALHPVLYNALKNYVKENHIGNETAVFENVYNGIFRKASFSMGSLFGYTEKGTH